jgi:hypothetical protein
MARVGPQRHGGEVTLMFPIVSRKETTGLLASLSYHRLGVSSAVTLTSALLYFGSERSWNYVH